MLVFVLVCITLCPFYFWNYLKEEYRAGCFVPLLTLLLLSCGCFVTVNVLWLFSR